MRRLYASAIGTSLPLIACAPEPVPGPEIAIVAHQLDNCRLPDERAALELNALGDFDASTQTTGLVSSDDRGAPLAFPLETLAVAATANFERSSERFSGVSDYDGSGAMRLLLWPSGRECRLDIPGTPAGDYPVAGAGQGIGYSKERSLLMLAGSNAAQSHAVSGALVFDASTGDTDIVPPGSAQLREPRAFASVSEFGPGFLVAGGENPTVTFPSGRRRLHQTAEVYVAAEGRFDESRSIELLLPRTRHAALALSLDATLLIGGRTTSDAGEEQALAHLELVSVGQELGRHVGLLEHPRISPKIVELGNGSIFVAGGYDSDGRPVPGAEWIQGDPSQGFSVQAEGDLFAGRANQDFVAMAGSAVLAIGGCEERSGPDAECEMCPVGFCRPREGWDGFWISGDREVVRFTLDVAAARPRLISAADGAPYLIADAAAGQDVQRLWRFDPWAQSFVPAANLEAAPQPDLPVSALDAGAAVWVSERDGQALLMGRRFSLRNEFAQDLELITLVNSTSALWPLHLAPGQGSPVGATPRARLVPRDAREGLANDFVLELRQGADVWVTDARYGDFEVELTWEQGDLPRLLVDVGGRECSWPSAGAKPPGLLVARRSGHLIMLSRGEAEAVCDRQLEQRVALGLKGGDDFTHLSKLNIRRTLR